jgi:hypothetical protein
MDLVNAVNFLANLANINVSRISLIHGDSKSHISVLASEYTTLFTS